MVDLRPLLFINFLFVLLLVMAVIIQFSPLSENSMEKVPGTSLANMGPHNLASDTALAHLEQDKQTDAINKEAPPDEHTGSGAEKPASLVSVQEADDAAFKDEAIFTDEVQLPHKHNETLQSVAQHGTVNDMEEPMVIAYNHEPKQSPVTTGKIIVRSNVHDDTVLVNGKPYGPTMLELELTPGSYTIEVAKSGYNSWNTQIDVRRGMNKTIEARLEHFSKVEYRDGTWLHNIQTGEGSYLDKNNLEYNGSFINGKFHGSGSIRYANGMKYQGEWFEGKMQGQGSLTTPDGDTYIGEMDDNKFNGEGTLTKATGDIYSGFWIDGVLNGQGSLTTKDGLLYVGGFADNLFHGNGSLTYPDGSHYEGSFSNGMFHGKGVETYPNGKKYVGQFIDGLYHGKGEILNPNGSKITGTFKNGEPFGKATLTTAEGEVFTARSSEPGVCYRLKSYRAIECPQLEGW